MGREVVDVGEGRGGEGRGGEGGGRGEERRGEERRGEEGRGGEGCSAAVGGCLQERVTEVADSYIAHDAMWMDVV